MLAPGNAAKMLAANSRQTGNFIFRENLLSGFNGDHSLPSFVRPAAFSVPPEMKSITLAFLFLSNSCAVC
jgi:hypothetical protein